MKRIEQFSARSAQTYEPEGFKQPVARGKRSATPRIGSIYHRTLKECQNPSQYQCEIGTQQVIPKRIPMSPFPRLNELDLAPRKHPFNPSTL